MADFEADLMIDDEQGFCQFSDEEVNEVRKVISNGGVQALEPYLRQTIDDWKTVPLNVGIVGNSGAGKSSFINAIRGITADDDGAAATGVTKIMEKPTAYSHPNNDMLKFWDLPLVGTPMFPKETYLRNIGFARFDFFLIISSNRFTKNDLWLSTQISRNGRKFLFVRTKIHLDVLNDKMDRPKTHDRETLLRDVHRNIENNLGEIYNAEQVFLIDNHYRQKYQFEALEQKLIDDFPTLKRQALVMSMSALSVDMIKRKVQELRSSIWKAASLSVGLAAPGVSIITDVSMIVTKSVFYFKQLGLDEDSLKKTAKLTSSNLKCLQAVVDEDCPVKAFLTMQGINGLMAKIPALAAVTAVEEVSRQIPIIGSIISASISFGTTYATLSFVLNRMECIALDVVKVATKDSASDVILDEDDDESD